MQHKPTNRKFFMSTTQTHVDDVVTEQALILIISQTRGQRINRKKYLYTLHM